MFSSSADTLVICGLAKFIYFYLDFLIRLKDSLYYVCFEKTKVLSSVRTQFVAFSCSCSPLGGSMIPPCMNTVCVLKYWTWELINNQLFVSFSKNWRRWSVVLGWVCFTISSYEYSLLTQRPQHSQIIQRKQIILNYTLTDNYNYVIQIIIFTDYVG